MGIIRGEIGDLTALADVSWNRAYRASGIEAPAQDTLLAALGGDVSLREAVYEASISFANRTMCNWTEKLDVHLPMPRGREGIVSWDYLDVTADDTGRIWIEESGNKRDRAEYWLSLATLALSGVPLGKTVVDETDWVFAKASSVASWFFAPSQYDARYMLAMKAVSECLQQALRSVARWWLLDQNNFANSAMWNAMLVFAAMPVRAGRTRATVIPDVLGGPYGRHTKGMLKRLRETMEDLHLDLPSERFNPQLAPYVIAAVDKQPHSLNRLLMEQSSLLETFFQLSEEARICPCVKAMDETAGLRVAARLASSIARELHVKMRRFAPEVSTSMSAPMVLVAASTGMAEHAVMPYEAREAAVLNPLFERKPAA